MPTKADLEEQVQLYKEQMTFLREQLEDAREERNEYRLQVDKLQDALINIRAPDAYRDMKADELAPEEYITDVARSRQQQLQEATGRIMRQIEEPLFVDGNDLDDLLMTALNRDSVPSEAVSIHGNNES